MPIQKIVAGTLAAVLATCAVAAADARPSHHPHRASTLQRDVERVQRSGGIVGVEARVDDGRRVRQARAGVAQLGTRTPIPYNARFRVASTTKTFVATVVLQLVDEGVLSLDDTVEHWLPGVVHGHGNDGRRITVRDLIGQRSGLFDYVQDEQLLHHIATDIDKYRYDDSTPQRWLQIALRHRPTAAPGTTWHYSNTNYVLAALIVQRATGRTWSEQVEHRIIAWLGLRHTYSSGANPFLTGPHAHSYVQLPGAEPLDLTENSIGHAGDSGLVSTTADLGRFFRALQSGRLLSPASMRVMHTTVAADDPYFPMGRYGLGIRRVPLSCGGYYWGHEGDHPGGFHTRSAVTADGRRSVIVSTTSGLTPRNGTALNTLTDDALCGR